MTEINIDDLTIGQLRQLPTLGNCSVEPDMLARYVGKYVIVRSRNEGINAGVVHAIDSTCVILKNARRIWWHKPKAKGQSWYEGVSLSGLSDDSKVSPAVAEKAIIEDYSITVCSVVSRESIEEMPNHVG